MTDVFISYSRKDQEFVRFLHQALVKSQRDTWVDWEDIPLTADWWEEIKTGIEASDTFIFVISPDSLASKVCGQEVDYAVLNHKRLIPIVRRDGFESAVVPAAVGRHNWLFFRETDDFDQAFSALITALDTDLEYVKFHTRLLMRAREWEAKAKAPDYLLRGEDLDMSETWLAQAVEKSPRPTALQQDYVWRSRQAETQRQHQARHRLKIFGASVSVLALLALGAATIAFQQRQNAIRQENLAYQQSKLAFIHQLAVAVQAPGQSQILSQKESRSDDRETALAFGIDSLPPPLATILRQEQPRLIVFSPSRDFVAVINQEFGLRAWHIPSQRTVLQWRDVADVVDVGFSPDETLMTVATRDGVLHVWRVNATTYQAVAALKGHAAGLTDTAFNPDGSLLATASEDGGVRLWDMGQILNEKKRQAAQIRQSQPIRSLTFSPDGQYLVTGSDDQTLRVWSLNSQEILCIRHSAPVRLVAFNTDGTQLGSVSGSTVVRVWSWPRLLEQGSAFRDVSPTCQ